MNLEQAFNFLINSYPSIYASNSLESSKYKIHDHFFNTIGNGYNSLNKLIKKLTITPDNESLINNFPSKYINGETLYIGYTKMRDIGLDRPDINSMLNELFTEEEKKLRIDVIKFKPLKINDAVPYPNFTKEYSMVWTMDMNQLDISWIEGAIEFYSQSKDFFNNGKVNLYHSSWPDEVEQQKKLIANYENNFTKYKKEGQSLSDFYKAISDAYEINYDGNTEKLIKNRWNKELNRIRNFIDETIEKLNNDLINHPNYSNKKKLKP